MKTPKIEAGDFGRVQNTDSPHDGWWGIITNPENLTGALYRPQIEQNGATFILKPYWRPMHLAQANQLAVKGHISLNKNNGNNQYRVSATMKGETPTIVFTKQ